ncbi:MAG: phage holin family protein, partial [bacterium]
MSGGGMGRVTALMSSVMDLHVRIALHEVGKEKRRVIGGGVFLAMGMGLASMACLALQLALILWIRERFGLSWLHTALVVTALNAVLATICLRVGGQLLKGPFLPETTAGLVRTTRAITGRLS